MKRVKGGYTHLVTWHPCNNKRFDSLTEFPDIPQWSVISLTEQPTFATTPLVSLWNNVGSLLRLVIFLYHFLTLFFVNPTCQCWNKATMKRVMSFMWHWSLCCARWPCMLLLFKWELKTQGWGVVLKENLVRGMPPRLYNHVTLCKTKPVCFASLFKTGDLLWPGWPGWFISFAYRIKCYCLCFFS